MNLMGWMDEINWRSKILAKQDQTATTSPGLGICSLVFWGNRSFFVSESVICLVYFKWIPIFCSFLKSDVSKSLTMAQSEWAKSDGNDSLLGHKKRKNCQKHTKKISSELLVFASNLLESLVNHSQSKERCSERIAHGHSLKWVILSTRANSKRANSQPWTNPSSPEEVHTLFLWHCPFKKEYPMAVEII